MKKFLALICLFCLACSIVPRAAEAATDLIGSSRIGFYYQYAGGGKDQKGTYDTLLASRLYSLYGHSTIYMSSSTSKYLTGRGCCLFAHAHAYQFLLGKAATNEQRADILYKFLKIKPKWSNTGSSMSPPNSESIYKNYLASLPGVSLYSGNMNTASAVASFFTGGKSVAIVHVPNHFVCAIGCTVYNGTRYIHIVDSAITGTIAKGRLQKAYSLDFSTTYTVSNVVDYSGKVFEYYLPYSEFTKTNTSIKAEFRAAFVAGSMPAYRLIPQKDELLLTQGSSAQIVITNSEETIAYTSSNVNVCTVSSTGLVTYVGPGTAKVTCGEIDALRNSCTVNVCCVQTDTSGTLVAGVGEKPKPRLLSGTLPAGAKFVLSDQDTSYVGARVITVKLLDKNGDEVARYNLTLAVVSPASTLVLPAGLKVIESGAFENSGAFLTLVIPPSVDQIGAGAFAQSQPAVVFCADPSLVSGMFGGNTVVVNDPDAYYSWANS
ncbi:MAG: leucine-rich repeat domain-containing protein [Clostridiales bacterium]|nr:leucine-rich repeat domain-containing protein [Clostridiales bacterium]